MKKITLILLLLLVVAPELFAKKPQFGIGIAYADISGINAYKANSTRNTNAQVTNGLSVPFFFVSKTIADKFSLSYRYSYYGEIKSKGVSPDSDIFNQGGISLPVVTEYQFKERMHENTLAINYTILDKKQWLIALGPNLSLTRSNVEFFDVTQNNRSINVFSETDYSIGAELSASYNIRRNMNIIFNYRYSSTGNKDISLLELAMSYQF